MWYPILDQKSFLELLHDIEQECNSIKWIKYKRANVSALPCYSMTFGETMRPYHGRCPSTCNKKFPRLYQLLQQLSMNLRFHHSSYTLNKNLECLPHKDKNNLGDSLILSFGNFSGGNLLIEGKKFDIYKRPLQFNGSLLTHSTEPFQGTRYSIVLYNIKTKNKNT